MLCTSDTALKKLLYILFTLNLILTSFYAQPSITWSRIYDGPIHYYDYAWDMCKSKESTFFITGRTGGETGYLIRINNFGDTIWTKTFPGGGIMSICSSGDGGCVFIKNLAITKIDSNGTVVWQKGDSLYVTPYDIIQTTDGGYIACGTFGYNSKIMQFDSVGNLKWSKEYSSIYYLSFYSIKEALNTGYLIAGTDRGIPGMDTSKSVLLHIDYSGNIIWEKKYKIFNRSTHGSKIEINGNHFILSGTTLDTGQYFNKSRPYFMRLDTTGNVLFSKVFPGANECEDLQDFKITSSNKFIFSSILLLGRYCNDSILAKIFITDSIGNMITSRILTSSQDIELKTILPLSNGDILFSGVLENYFFTNYEDILVIRTDSLLNSPPIGIQSVYSSVPDKFYLCQNYPNPFNPTTKIKFSIPTPLSPPFAKGGRTQSGGFVTLKIYDVLGREIAVLVNKRLQPGTYEVDWDASNYPSGVYFYRLSAGEYSESKKMVLIK
jgi:hypothetical protein